MTERVLYLIRHGRSDESSNDLRQTPRGPQWDPPLDEQGREQAELLARRLLVMRRRPVAIYTSTMRRTKETIAPYVARTGVEVHEDDDLIEANIGAWENKTFEEIVGSDEEIIHLVRDSRSIWHRAPGGESAPAFGARVNAAVDRILERHPDGDVVVVCHGGVINAALGPLLGIDHEMFFVPENTSVNSIEVDGGTRRVRFLNDILHLTDPQLFSD